MYAGVFLRDWAQAAMLEKMNSNTKKKSLLFIALFEPFTGDSDINLLRQKLITLTII